ncbi:MAG: hypothetical protein WEB79_04225 [Thermoleophilaceae bacterium]
MKPIGIWAFAVVAALGAVAAGCGAAGDRERIRAAIYEARAAIAVRDAERVCSLLTAAGREHVASVRHGTAGDDVLGGVKTCENEVPAITEAIGRDAGRPALPPPEVVRIAVDGDRARAVLRVTEGISLHVALAREDGEWRLDALFGDLPGARQEDKF